MFIIFTVHHCIVKNQNVNLCGLWQELGNVLDMQQPVPVNKLFFWWNGYWKHFADKTVKTQTCQFMLYLTKCHRIYRVSVCIAKTSTDSWVLLVPQCLFCIKLQIEIPNTANFWLFWFLHGCLQTDTVNSHSRIRQSQIRGTVLRREGHTW